MTKPNPKNFAPDLDDTFCAASHEYALAVRQAHRNIALSGFGTFALAESAIKLWPSHKLEAFALGAVGVLAVVRSLVPPTTRLFRSRQINCDQA
jgi:hypothetical protein